jgi:hypothetical protein
VTTVPCPHCGTPLPVLGLLIQPHRAFGDAQCVWVRGRWDVAYASHLAAAEERAERDRHLADLSREKVDNLQALLRTVLEAVRPRIEEEAGL